MRAGRGHLGSACPRVTYRGVGQSRSPGRKPGRPSRSFWALTPWPLRSNVQLGPLLGTKPAWQSWREGPRWPSRGGILVSELELVGAAEAGDEVRGPLRRGTRDASRPHSPRGRAAAGLLMGPGGTPAPAGPGLRGRGGKARCWRNALCFRFDRPERCRGKGDSPPSLGQKSSFLVAQRGRRDKCYPSSVRRVFIF